MGHSFLTSSTDLRKMCSVIQKELCNTNQATKNRLLIKVARAFDVTVPELLGRTDKLIEICCLDFWLWHFVSLVPSSDMSDVDPSIIAASHNRTVPPDNHNIRVFTRPGPGTDIGQASDVAVARSASARFRMSICFSPFQSVNLIGYGGVESVRNIMSTAIAARTLISLPKAKLAQETRQNPRSRHPGQVGFPHKSRQICRRHAPSRGRLLGMQAHS